MTDNGELHTMPNGSAVWFVEETHGYFPAKEDGGRGRRCLGVTTPAKRFDSSIENLLKWAAETGYLGIAELVAPLLDGDMDIEKLTWLTSQDGIIRRLNQAGLDFESVRNRKGKTGTEVHRDVLQALAEGVPVPDFEAMSKEAQGYADAVTAFWLDYQPEALQVEQVIYSEKLNVAGTADLRCTMKDHPEPGVLDLKTGFISESAHVQVGGGYPALFEDAGFGSCEWAYLLSVKDDGTYDLLPARGNPHSFKLAVLLHQEANRIKRESRNDRERASTDRKLAKEIEEAVKAE